jgi:hypothetical protein
MATLHRNHGLVRFDPSTAYRTSSSFRSYLLGFAPQVALIVSVESCKLANFTIVRSRPILYTLFFNNIQVGDCV